MRSDCRPMRHPRGRGAVGYVRRLLFALFCLLSVPQAILADNCDLEARGWNWNPNPVSIGESTSRKVYGSFKSLQMKECKVTSQSWEWEITDVEYNADLTAGTWASSPATLPKVEFADTGTRTSTSQNPTMRFKTEALDKVGRWRLQYRVRASYASEDCGMCAGSGWKPFTTPDVVVADILIESIQFKSDHGLLRDYTTDYDPGGDLFPEPEWLRKVRSAPISHTKKTKVDVKVTLKGGAGDNGTYKLKSPQFGEVNVTLAGGTGSADMTSIDPLQNKIERAWLQYDWQIIDAANKVVATAKTTHEAYLTFGTPREPTADKHKVTLIRMRRAVAFAGKSTKPDDRMDIILEAMRALGNFQQDDDNVVNAWTVPDGKADCAEQSRFIKKVIYMVGIEGEVKTMLVYAVPAAPKTAIEEEHGVVGCKYGLNTPEIHPTKPTWQAWLDAGNPNAFESTVRFSSGGKTKYFPGGVPGASYDTPKEVLLNIFKGLGWYDTSVPGTFLGRGKFQEYVAGGKYP